jgi:outer membrane protein assembly factor BamB
MKNSPKAGQKPGVRCSARLPKVVAILFAASMTCLAASPLLSGEDWPWIYGPRHDHTSPQKGLLRTWPPSGPKVLWTIPVAPGFGGPAVSGGRVYLLDRDESVGDVLRVLDFGTGKELWNFPYNAPGKFMFAGSRTTPTIDNGHVYTVGPLGDLHAISIATRKPAWRKNIWKDFGGGEELPRWAITQNPLIYGDLLIVAPQTQQTGVVAYDKHTGEVKWKSVPLSGIPGYVTPSIVKVPGVGDHLVMITGAAGRGRTARGGSVNGLDPRTGKLLWTYTNWQCIIPVPGPVDAGDGRFLITGAYSAGTAMIKVEKNGSGFKVTELFKNPDFGSHTQPPILFNGHFYSHYTINERSDGLVAMTMDGQVKWRTDQQPPFVRGGSVLADGLMLTTDGNSKLYLIEPNPARFKPLASTEILAPGDNWAPLALVDGKLLVRGQRELKVLQVAQP